MSTTASSTFQRFFAKPPLSTTASAESPALISTSLPITTTASRWIPALCFAFFGISAGGALDADSGSSTTTDAGTKELVAGAEVASAFWAAGASWDLTKAEANKRQTTGSRTSLTFHGIGAEDANGARNSFRFKFQKGRSGRFDGELPWSRAEAE